MTTETKTRIEDELKRFAADLSLSDDQKSKLRSALERAQERIEEAREKNPNISREDVAKRVMASRDQIREAVQRFLTPQQLTKWDAEIAKAKTFLGQQLQA